MMTLQQPFLFEMQNRGIFIHRTLSNNCTMANMICNFPFIIFYNIFMMYSPVHLQPGAVSLPYIGFLRPNLIERLSAIQTFLAGALLYHRSILSSHSPSLSVWQPQLISIATCDYCLQFEYRNGESDCSHFSELSVLC